MLYVGKYPQIYPHTILGLGNVSRDGLPRGTLPSGIFKLEKYCPGLKVRHPITFFACQSLPGSRGFLGCFGPQS